MTIADHGIDAAAASLASLRGNLRAQARPGRIVMLRAEEANVLLDYIEALEWDRDGWRNVAAARAERIAELEQQGAGRPE